MKLESGKAGSGGLSPLSDPARDMGPKQRSLKEFSGDRSSQGDLESGAPKRRTVKASHTFPAPSLLPRGGGGGRFYTWNALGREAWPRGARKKLEGER